MAARVTSRGAGDAIRVQVLVDGLDGGGAELTIADLASAAPAAGIELRVACLYGILGDAAARLRNAGVEPVHLGAPGRLGPASVALVRRHLETVRPDVVHTHLDRSDLLGLLAARSKAIPAVSTVHSLGAGERTGRNRVVGRLAVAARRRLARRVLAVSDSARDAYLRNGWDRPDHVVTVRNGISRAAAPGAGRRVRDELGIAPDAPVITMLSSLRPEKAHGLALASLPALLARFPNARLVIAGDGPLLAEVRAAAQPFGDAVHVLGHRSDALELLDATDVLLHPSYHEAFPTTLIEAAVAGVPAVATAVGGIPEIVRHGITGILIATPPGAAQVAAAVGTLLADSEMRREMGSAARRDAGRFGADDWARRLLSEYRRTTGF